MKLTKGQIAQRRALLKKHEDDRKSRPEFVEMLKFVQEIWTSTDVDLCGYAANMMLKIDHLTQENERLSERLNNILQFSDGVFDNEKLEPHVKRNIARKILECWPENAAALVYSEIVKAENDEDKRVTQRKALLSEAGSLGKKNGNRLFAQLKSWALHEATGMRGQDKEIAINLAARLPKNLEGVSDDPKRLIYDALRASKKH